MAVFSYKGVDSSGRDRKGTLEAETVSQAGARLRGKGIFPSEVSKIEVSTRKGRNRNRTGKIPRRELAAATRQMATLLGAGLTLVAALEGSLGQIRSPRLKLIFTQVKDHVTEGRSLARALEEHPDVFPATFCALVKAGEASGTLELIMEQLADFEEQRLALVRKIRSSLAYPVLMLITGVSVLGFLLAYVVPRVTRIFADYGQALPLPTRILMTVSGAVQEWWWAGMLAAILAGAGFRWWARTDTGRTRVHAFLLAMPVLGDLVHGVVMVRFARTLGTLLKNEVPLLTALGIVRNVAGNEVVIRAIDEMRQEISEGETIAGPMRQRKVFPDLLVQMVSAGEQSGTLDRMLLKVADDLEGQTTARMGALMSLFEPLMIIFLGGVVGFVVLAVLLPIFEMSHLVG